MMILYVTDGEDDVNTYPIEVMGSEPVSEVVILLVPFTPPPLFLIVAERFTII